MVVGVIEVEMRDANERLPVRSRKMVPSAYHVSFDEVEGADAIFHANGDPSSALKQAKAYIASVLTPK